MRRCAVGEARRRVCAHLRTRTPRHCPLPRYKLGEKNVGHAKSQGWLGRCLSLRRGPPGPRPEAMTIEYDCSDFNEVTAFFRWRGTVMCAHLHARHNARRLFTDHLARAPSTHALPLSHSRSRGSGGAPPSQACGAVQATHLGAALLPLRFLVHAQGAQSRPRDDCQGQQA